MLLHWNTAIHHEGYLYGSSGKSTSSSDIRCVEMATGKVAWVHKTNERSSLFYVDEHFISIGEYGTLSLIEASLDRANIITKTKLTDQAGNKLLKYPVWAVPVLSNGYLYLLGKNRLVCLDTVYSDHISPDAEIERSIQPYQQKADFLAIQHITTLSAPLLRRGSKHALGNLIADVLRVTAIADVALTNNAGTRRDLPAGVITYEILYELLPFDNQVVVLSVSGEKLKEILEFVVYPKTLNAHVSGIRLVYDPHKPRGQRIQNIQLADGASIKSDHTYTLATSDFIAWGGDGYDMLKDQPKTWVGPTRLEALIAYLSAKDEPVSIEFDERIIAQSE